MDEIIDALIHREGGFVDHPADKGGPTKFGITQATLSDWRGQPVTVDDVASLSVLESKRIYLSEYVVKPGFSTLPDPIRELVVDCAVNHGVKRATEMLQKSVGATVDGVLGPKTREKIAAMDPRAVFKKMVAERVKLYGRIIRMNPSQSVFAEGWAARAAEFIERI